MNQIFYLDDLEIEEPIGFEDIELSIKRDDIFHGMSYEASTSSLQFFGEAFTYLKNKKETEGVKANVLFRALSTCETYDYEELISGRLNFGKYKESCGDICTISLPVEQQSCAITLQARKDQKVDVDKQTGVDNNTILDPYVGLGVETELPAHELFVGIDANVLPGGYNIDNGDTGVFNNEVFAFRPLYEVKRGDSLDNSNVDSGTDSGATPATGIYPEAVSPLFLLDNTIECFNGEYQYDLRKKGSINITKLTPIAGHVNLFRVRLAKGVWPSPLTDIQVNNLTLFSGSASFDETMSGSTTLVNGEGLYFLLEVGYETDNPFIGVELDISVIFDEESSVIISATKSCPATNAELYFIHETLSRVSESITNGCVRVKSSFYGRTDSEPFSFQADGCGGLRSLTSGLKIRQAVEDKFFTSLKDLLEGLNAIDNIGFDMIPDPNSVNGYLLRIEGVEYFYQDIEILSHDAIPKASTEIEETKHYSRIQVGYKKWEVEKVNGLDEFNSNREYNTSIDTINSPLDITSILVAGTYPIEITRQQSFAVSGGADTKYDNETFIICMERPSYPYGSLQVELGNITNAANIFSPATIYNYRLSPIRNLMRWYKNIAAGFASLSDASNMLFFSSGTGNLTASGLMTDTFCREENSEIVENQNIFVTKFTSADQFTPLWKNELITYEYPMSIADYRAIKENPYGYISAQCGSGDFEKYWIKEIKYKPMKGTATIAGRRKYGS